MMERLAKTYSDGTHGANDNLPSGENLRIVIVYLKQVAVIFL